VKCHLTVNMLDVVFCRRFSLINDLLWYLLPSVLTDGKECPNDIPGLQPRALRPDLAGITLPLQPC
jgi:hypothetical protein